MIFAVRRVTRRAAAVLLAVLLPTLLLCGCVKDGETRVSSTQEHPETTERETQRETEKASETFSAGGEAPSNQRTDIPIEMVPQVLRECSAGAGRYLDMGMSVMDTGETTLQDGVYCNVYALGTSRDGQFVREIYLCFDYLDRVVYEYDAVSDTWTQLP